MRLRNWSRNLWHQTLNYFQKTQFVSTSISISIKHLHSNTINEIQFIFLLIINMWYTQLIITTWFNLSPNKLYQATTVLPYWINGCVPLLSRWKGLPKTNLWCNWQSKWAAIELMRRSWNIFKLLLKISNHVKFANLAHGRILLRFKYFCPQTLNF